MTPEEIHDLNLAAAKAMGFANGEESGVGYPRYYARYWERGGWEIRVELTPKQSNLWSPATDIRDAMECANARHPEWWWNLERTRSGNYTAWFFNDDWSLKETERYSGFGPEASLAITRAYVAAFGEEADDD